MIHHAADPLRTPTAPPHAPASPTSADRQTPAVEHTRAAEVEGAADPATAVEPMDVAEWLEDRMHLLSERWLREVLGRFDGVSNGGDGVLERFIPLLTCFLPAVLGPFRDQVEPLWARAAELFGRTAAHRGLAADPPGVCDPPSLPGSTHGGAGEAVPP